MNPGDRIRFYRRDAINLPHNGRPGTVQAIDPGGSPRRIVLLDGEQRTRMVHPNDLQPLDAGTGDLQ
ncbi:MAG: hypothetical protein R2695_04030 [Acidimicrobiales bacterium]